MTAPARSSGVFGLSFGTFGLIIRLAASVLFGYLFMESPTFFSSAPAYAGPWYDAVLGAIVSAFFIFGLSFLARTGGPRVDRIVNTGLTVLLAIPVIFTLPFLCLVLLRLAFG